MFSIPTHIASSDPTANSDKSNGFIQGQFWFNDDSNELFVCESDLDAAAVWTSVSGESSPSWQTWTPTLSWTGTSPASSSYVARYTTDGNTVHFVLYINFTSDSSPPTGLNVTLPVTPADIENPIMPVMFVSRTGSVYSKGEYPYIDMDNPTGSSRKLYFGNGFSLVADTTYGWCISGFYEISS